MKIKASCFYQRADFRANLTPNLLVASIIMIFLVIPNLMQGMAGDGLIYATMANNMAHHIGSFWQPQFSQTTQAIFYDHPPLALYIESLFYHSFGDGFYVEKLYNLFTATINMYLVIKIWQRCTQPHTRWLLWLPLICWLLIPMNSYAYKSNLLENTLTCFTNLAIYLILLSIFANRMRRYILLFFAALSISLGFFCNGLQCFFPLVTILLYYFVLQTPLTWKKSLSLSLLLTVFTVAMISLALCYEPARTNISQYFTQQIMATLGNHRTTPQTGIYRLTIFYFLLQSLLPLILISLIFVTTFKWRKPTLKIFNSPLAVRWIIFFILLALAASLPVMISPRQQDNYLMPAYPMFAIAFAIMLYHLGRLFPILTWLKTSRVSRVISIILLCLTCVVAALSFGKIARDKILLEDILQINQQIAPDSLVYIDRSLQSDSQVHGYFFRYHHISLTTEPNTEFLIIVNQAGKEAVPNDYELIKLPLRHFLLYRKKVT